MRLFFFILFLFGAPFGLWGQQDDLVALRKELDQKQGTHSKKSSIEMLNVSYDPTREFYDQYNPLFARWWREKTDQSVFVVQSHGGSGKQARAVISGLEADVVSLALAFDIDAIQKRTGVVGENWQQRLPNNSSPYYSTIVFLVRKGNPKGIKDWDDLAKKGVSIVTPNPKTSGGARWTYMAAWAWALKAYKGDLEKVQEYMVKLYANAPVMDAGARASSTTFVQRKMGDVLLTWENEAYLTMEKISGDEFEILYPSVSIKGEPPVTWLDTYLQENGTEDVAKFYLKYLYSAPAQELIAQYHFRPYDWTVQKKYEEKFPKVNLITIDDFGGWDKVQEKHFVDGGLFDTIFQEGRD